MIGERNGRRDGSTVGASSDLEETMCRARAEIRARRQFICRVRLRRREEDEPFLLDDLSHLDRKTSCIMTVTSTSRLGARA